MKMLNLTETKVCLSAVLQCAGGAIARISRVESPQKPGLLGMFEGQGWMAEDFDAWPEEAARALGIID